MGHRLWEKVRCQHKLSAPSSSSAITHQPSKVIRRLDLQVLHSATRDQVVVHPLLLTAFPVWKVHDLDLRSTPCEERH